MPRRRGLFRKPSLRGRISARTSLPRIVRHNLGLKAPRGWGWVTNPRKALYNRVYRRTSIGCVVLPGCLLVLGSVAAWLHSSLGYRPPTVAAARVSHSGRATPSLRPQRAILHSPEDSS